MLRVLNLASVSSGGSVEGCWGFPISQVCLRVDLLKDAGGSQLVKCVFGWMVTEHA